MRPPTNEPFHPSTWSYRLSRNVAFAVTPFGALLAWILFLDPEGAWLGVITTIITVLLFLTGVVAHLGYRWNER